MFCSNCEKEIESGKFCPYCGYKQEENKIEMPVKEVAESNDEKKSNKLVFLPFVVVLAVVCVGVFLFMGQSKSDKFIKMLKEGEYAEAAAYYQSDLTGNEKELQKVYEVITKEIDTLVNSYADGNMSYDDVKNGLNSYSVFYATETEKALDSINAMKASKDAFMSAEKDYENEDYKKAYESYAKVIEGDSNLSLAKEKQEECYSIIKEQIFSRSKAEVDVGDYLAAIDILEEELEFLNETDQTDAATKIEEYKGQFLADNIEPFDQYLANEEYDKCFDLIDIIAEGIETTEGLEKQMKALYDAYEAYVEGQVEVYLETRDIVTCMQLVKTGQMMIPTSEKFVEMEKILQEYIPVSLYEMEPFSFGDVDLGTDATREDTMGNVWNNVLYGYMGADDNQYNLYNIDGKYNTLKATVAVNKKSKGTKKIGFIKIYGDNLLLWEDTNISSMTEPYEINVNISGVKHLKIAMCGPKYSMGNGMTVLLCDPVLQK